MAIKGYISDENGNIRCPTEVCNAVCCRSSHFVPGIPGPCDFLNTCTNRCGLHELGGPKAKPVGCFEYPRNQADIDSINRQAEAAGFTERCQLVID